METRASLGRLSISSPGPRGFDNVGIVLQAYLRRAKDVADAIAERWSVRICKEHLCRAARDRVARRRLIRRNYAT
jgi:hypothetical protein